MALTQPITQQFDVASSSSTGYMATCNPVGRRYDPVRLLCVVDVFSLVLSFIAAQGLATLVNGLVFHRSLDNLMDGGLEVRVAQYLGIASCVILWFALNGHYRQRSPVWIEVKRVFAAIGFAMLVDGFLQFASKEDFSRLWLIGNWLLAAILITFGRRLARQYWQRQGLWTIATLLIGSGAKANDVRMALASDPQLGYGVVQQIHNLETSLRQSGSSWQQLYKQYGAQFAVIAMDGAELSGAANSFRQLMREGLPFAVVPSIQCFPVHGMQPFYFFNHDVHLWIASHNLDNRLSQIIKRITDIVLSIGLLALLSLPMLVIATLVKLDGGSAFFLDRRLGRNGRAFNCLKFRSMVTHADKVLQAHLQQADAAVKQEWLAYKKLRGHDPRVTRMGKFLRKTSLDELPQLINVLIGDMSLVGPRPILQRELAAYDVDIAHYYKVRPGITGLWQVSGRNHVTYAERVEMDSWYIRNWSLWHDFAIILKTIPVLLQRKGAF